MAASVFIRDGTYRVRSAQQTAYLELQGNDNIITAVPLNASNDAQMWRIAADSDGTYQIICVRGDFFMSPRGSRVVGVRLNHTWTIEPRGNSFVFGNPTDRTALHLTEAGRVSVWDRNNSISQRWLIDPNPRVGSSSAISPPRPIATVQQRQPFYTYSSDIHQTTAFTAVAESKGGWRGCLAVQMPEPSSAGLQLDSLSFVIKYANLSMTKHGGTHQLDIVLTSETLPTGITVEQIWEERQTVRLTWW